MTRPTTTGKAQDLITFTRSTTGTALAKISYGEELVTNGDFSSDVSGWTLAYVTASHTPDGIKLQGNGYAYQSVPTVAGKRYVLTGNVTAFNNGNSVADYEFRVGTSTYPPNLYDGPSQTGVRALYAEFTATTTTSFIVLKTHGTTGGTQTVTWDNISVKEVSFDQPDGTLQLFNHPINKPRIEYDASGNCLGLLVEETRSNRVPYSDLSAHWNWVNTTDIGGAATAPDGTQTATLMRENTAGTAHITFAAIVSASTSTTASIFAKAGGRRYLQLSASTNQTSWAVFDLEQGVVTAQAASGITATIEPYGNGWYRCNAALTLPASGTTTNFVWGSSISATSGDRSVYQGDGVSGIYLWGAQVETGSFPTSYIPTSGSNVTRAADVASLAVSEFGYNQDQGSFVVEFDHNDLNDESTQYLLSSTSSSRFIYNNASSQNWQAFDGQSALPFGNVLGNGLPVKLGLGMGSSESISINNGVIQNTTNATPQDNAGSLLYFGLRYNGANSLNGHVKSIQYYPLRLSNAQLQALTV